MVQYQSYTCPQLEQEAGALSAKEAELAAVQDRRLTRLKIPFTGSDAQDTTNRLAVVKGDPGKSGDFFVEAKLPANYAVPPHHHPTDETVRVIDGGTLNYGMGDKLDKSKEQFSERVDRIKDNIRNIEKSL